MKQTWLLCISESESDSITVYDFEAEDENEALQIVSEKVNEDAEEIHTENKASYNEDLDVWDDEDICTVYHPEICGDSINAAITNGVNNIVYTAYPLEEVVSPLKNTDDCLHKANDLIRKGIVFRRCPLGLYQNLEYYYCEEELYLVRDIMTHTMMFVNARSPKEAFCKFLKISGNKEECGDIDKLYSLLEHILSCTPCMDDCSDEENMVYSKMAELKDALVDAGCDK